MIKLQEEINGVIEELLEDEMNITHINNLIHAAATIMTQTLNEPSERSKNRGNVKFWEIRMQKQISRWLSIIAETGIGSDNGKLNRKKRKILKKYRVTNAREVALLTETLKQKVQAKAQRIRRYEKSLKKTLKILQKPGHEDCRGQRTSLYGRSRDLLEVTMGRRSRA